MSRLPLPASPLLTSSLTLVIGDNRRPLLSVLLGDRARAILGRIDSVIPLQAWKLKAARKFGEGHGRTSMMKRYAL